MERAPRGPAPRARPATIVGEPGVLEHAAGQRDGVEPAGAGQRGAAASTVAGRRPRGRRPPHGRRHRLAGASSAATNSGAGSSTSRPVLIASAHSGRPARRRRWHGRGQSLELDGRLALVADPCAARRSGAATASNSRPMLVVDRSAPTAGQLDHAGGAVVERRPPTAAAARRPPLWREPTPPPCATARGWPPTPPGSGTGREVADPLVAVETGDEELAAPQRAVADRTRGRRRPRRAPDPSAPWSTRQEATWAWWCCTPSGRQVQLERQLGARGTRGAGRGRPPRASRRRAGTGGRSPGRTTR